MTDVPLQVVEGGLIRGMRRGARRFSHKIQGSGQGAPHTSGPLQGSINRFRGVILDPFYMGEAPFRTGWGTMEEVLGNVLAAPSLVPNATKL